MGTARGTADRDDSVAVAGNRPPAGLKGVSRTRDQLNLSARPVGGDPEQPRFHAACVGVPADEQLRSGRGKRQWLDITDSGSTTFDHVSAGPLTFGPVSLPETPPGVDVLHSVETSRIEPRLTDTIARRRKAAGSDGPCRKRLKRALKNTPRTAAVGQQPCPLNAL
jgi:hypothetical protein